MDETVQAWQILSTYVPHRIRALGISNCKFDTLEMLYEAVDVKPTFVQVRFHPETQFEREMRSFCKEKGIGFQAHKVLKGNKEIIGSKLVGEVPDRVGVGRQVAFYLLVTGLENVCVVNRTKSEVPMKEDWDGVERLETWMQQEDNKASWDGMTRRFKLLIGEAS